MESVTVSFGEVSALVNVSLGIKTGDYVGIVGPSGSGKTTCLKAMAGSVPVNSGAISRAKGLRIGYVPQVETINWYFPVTVGEVVLMAGDTRTPRPWASRKDKLRASLVMERLGIGGLAGRHIRALSGGQQQRVFIARALMNDPALLFLDEPTSGVDVATRHDVLHLLHDLNHDDGTAVVITTHDLNGIAAHMHELICLNQRVVAAGPPGRILTPDVLEQTYGAPMDVLEHGGMPVVVEHVAHHEH